MTILKILAGIKSAGFTILAACLIYVIMTDDGCDDYGTDMLHNGDVSDGDESERTFKRVLREKYIPVACIPLFTALEIVIDVAFIFLTK